MTDPNRERYEIEYGRQELTATIDASGLVTVTEKRTGPNATLYTGRLMEADLVASALVEVFDDGYTDRTDNDDLRELVESWRERIEPTEFDKGQAMTNQTLSFCAEELEQLID